MKERNDLDLAQKLYSDLNEAFGTKTKDDVKATEEETRRIHRADVRAAMARYIIVALHSDTAGDSFIRTDPDPQYIVIDVKDRSIIATGFKSYEEAAAAFYGAKYGDALKEAFGKQTPGDVKNTIRTKREEDKGKKWFKVTKVYTSYEYQDYYVRAKDKQDALDLSDDDYEPDDTDRGNDEYDRTEVEETDEQTVQAVASHRWHEWRKDLGYIKENVDEAFGTQTPDDVRREVAKNGLTRSIDEVAHVRDTNLSLAEGCNDQGVNVITKETLLSLAHALDTPIRRLEAYERILSTDKAMDALRGAGVLEAFGKQTPEDVENALQVHVRDSIKVAPNGRKRCTYCADAIKTGESYLEVPYSSRWGRQVKNICKKCVATAAGDLGSRVVEAFGKQTKGDVEATLKAKEEKEKDMFHCEHCKKALDTVKINYGWAHEYGTLITPRVVDGEVINNEIEEYGDLEYGDTEYECPECNKTIHQEILG